MIVMAQKWFTKFAVQTSFVFSNIVPYLLEAVLSRVSCLIAPWAFAKDVRLSLRLALDVSLNMGTRCQDPNR